MRSRNLLRHGTDRDPDERTVLRAGPLVLEFQPGQAFVRYVRLREREIVRAIYSAVRDSLWNTVTPVVSNLRLLTTFDSFDLTFDVDCRDREIDFSWKGQISGRSDGTLIYSMDGVARSDFLRNRIGFCVLHPIAECVGRPCVVFRPDGTAERKTFPDLISPHQPFKNIKSLQYEVEPGVVAEISFTGDTFETEDQRNWMDQSYKTYCTPLELPLPARVRAGDRVAQTVSVRLLPGQVRLSSGPTIESDRTVLGPNDQASVPLPEVGVSLADEPSTLSPGQIRLLRRLGLSFVYSEIQLHSGFWPRRLARSLDQAKSLGVALDVGIELGRDADADLVLLADALRGAQGSFRRCALFQQGHKATSTGLVNLARQRLGESPKALFGGGSGTYFTELNRNRPGPGLDFVCFPLTPQVHAFDDPSVMETPASLPWAVETARRFAASLPIHAGPISLKPRFNPTAGAPLSPIPGRLPASVDPRQMSLLAAAWTLATAKYLAESGVASMTFFETIGWKGVMESESGSADPVLFPSTPGAVFPLYHVLADLGDVREATVVPTTSGREGGVQSLLLRNNGASRLMLANMTPRLQHVRATGCELKRRVLVRSLDESTAEEATSDPWGYRQTPGIEMEVRNDSLVTALLPYAVVTVDSVAGSERRMQ